MPLSISGAVRSRQLLSLSSEKGASDEIAFTSLNLVPLLRFAAAERPINPSTTISSFVLVLVAFVFAGSANVLFWSAFRFHPFAARSRQN
jgi:hypothetical protein